MTHPLETAGEPATLPGGLAGLMRPELASVGEEIIAEIRRTVPEYARPLDGPYGHSMRIGVEQALLAFVDHVADPGTRHDRRDDVCRKLGQNEALEGRSLDSLQSAYRVGARVAWQRMMRMGRRHTLSSAVMSLLADALFAYIDELASLSHDGYVEAQSRSAGAVAEFRRRLLQLILESPAVPRSALQDLAVPAGWTVPDEVTLVAVATGAKCTMPMLDGDVLPDIRRPDPYLLVPGQVGAGRQARLATAIPEGRLAVGLTVPLAGAPDSLRWARQALDLAEAGRLGDGRVTRCADCLPTLWLTSDNALVDQLARREFGKLDGLTPKQRTRLVETLGVWLETRGSAAEIADRLHVHPQTVRYRMRQLTKTFGDQLADPDGRFAIELVLRATRLRENEGADLKLS
ncbi:MAG TPA: helix-turn-helix domain-containing protein [Pseudonocardiaceae bacterium]|nr:helix-turn-helix domain-containing protein [Pseudonocardiaceae bacterium]